MALTYATYVASIANLMATDPGDSDFTTMLPNMIDYAEQRIYRDLDLINTMVRDTSATLTANSRNFTLPSSSGTFRVLNGINVLNAGVRVAQLTPVALAFADACYPAETATSATAVPAYFSMVTDQNVVVTPAPGAAWTAEVIGFIRPAPLSVSNTTTYLTSYLPDLFIAASMVFGSGWMRNFGAQADDKSMAMSWETQYGALMASANAESERQRFAAVSWTSLRPEANAIPQRG